MEQNNIPYFVADGVAQEAKVFAIKFRSGQSTQELKYRDFYQLAVQPYAERQYLSNLIIEEQAQKIDQLNKALEQTATALKASLTCIENILNKK